MEISNLEDITFTEQGFLLDQVTGLTYTLNKTGTLIFRYLRIKKSIQEIVNILHERYGITKDELTVDINDFILQLKECGLLKE